MEFEHITERNIEELDTEIEVENTKKIEAALFLSGRFMTIQELVSLTDVNPILLKKILSDLQDKYKDSGMTIIQKDNLFKMDVAENYAWMVNKLATGNSEFSKAEQETLAMIAYKQPIKQSVIVKIRGNKAYEHVKKFVELGLINKKKAGHTADLTLTEQFYEYFHVNAENNETLETSRFVPKPNLDGFKTLGFDSAQNSQNFDMLKEPEHAPDFSPRVLDIPQEQKNNDDNNKDKSGDKTENAS